MNFFCKTCFRKLKEDEICIHEEGRTGAIFGNTIMGIENNKPVCSCGSNGDWFFSRHINKKDSQNVVYKCETCKNILVVETINYEENLLKINRIKDFEFLTNDK